MARLIRTLRRSSSPNICSSYSLQTLSHGLQQYHHPSLRSHSASSTFFSQMRRAYVAENPKSPFESNILRILSTEIEYQSDYAPIQELATSFNSFTVHDRPGEQYITLKTKLGEDDIKIEATMFDGYVLVPKHSEDSTGEDLRLHISLLVDISKGDGSDTLVFLCSAWEDCLEIQKVYIIRQDKMMAKAKPYLGPDFKALDGKLRNALIEFLEARGVNNELSTFLHDYIMNKDRAELIRWLGKVKSFVEK